MTVRLVLTNTSSMFAYIFIIIVLNKQGCIFNITYMKIITVRLLNEDAATNRKYK